MSGPGQPRLYALDDLVEVAMWAYDLGRVSGDVAEVACAFADHQEPRLTSEQRVAIRLGRYTRCAAELAAALGRPAGYLYRGGPVDFDSGMPAGSACAWLRRTRHLERRVAA